MRTLRLFPVLVLALGLCGCGYIIESLVGSTIEDKIHDSSAIGIESVSKVVAEKVPPRTLVAGDGSTCTVPGLRYDHIRIGQRVVCVWGSRAFGASVHPRY